MRVAILGVGTRGAAWAARCRLMGAEVMLFDPEPGALARAQTACEAAGSALPALYDVALPRKGRMQETEGIAAAVDYADWVIEAAPDRLELKRALFRTALAEMAPEAMILSTARDIELEALQDCAPRPEALARVHSRSDAPVWLLPLIAAEAGAGQDLSRFLGPLGLAADDSACSTALSLAGGGDTEATVALLRALKARNQGAGAVLVAHEAALAPKAPEDKGGPLITLDRQVPPDWVDYNGHMNEARYLTAFSDGTDRLLLWAGMDAECIAAGHSVFTVETHIQHLDEVNIGDRITVQTRVLEGAGKRLHLWHEMYTPMGSLAATGEQLLLHMDLTNRKVALPREDVGAWLSSVAQAQAAAGLAPPEGLGRFVGAPRG